MNRIYAIIFAPLLLHKIPLHTDLTCTPFSLCSQYEHRIHAMHPLQPRTGSVCVCTYWRKSSSAINVTILKQCKHIFSLRFLCVIFFCRHSPTHAHHLLPRYKYSISMYLCCSMWFCVCRRLRCSLLARCIFRYNLVEKLFSFRIVLYFFCTSNLERQRRRQSRTTTEIEYM